jgi:hypothetical protein
VDGLAGDGIADPLCTLVFGAPALERLWVGGRPIVAAGHLTVADEHALATAAGAAARELAARAGR